MDFFHDIKSDDEDDDEDEEEEEPEKDESLELAPDAAGVPALPPLPGKSLAASAAKAMASAVPKAKADAAMEATGPPQSGPPSSAGIAVPSANDLQKELFAVYRPDQDPLGEFLSGTGRLVLALMAHKKMVRALRWRFSNAATMGDYDESPDLAKETDCIGEIILALGGKESANPDKTFSTPSDDPVPPDVTRPVLSLLGVGEGGPSLAKSHRRPQ